ncbi:hypothetical protein ILUMI_03918, partial [Ignelater luminosus]
LSDEENVDDDIGFNQTVHIDNVVGTLEVHSVLPVSTSVYAVTKSGKKKLCENQPNWRKQEPIYTKFENTPSSTSTISVNDEGKLNDFKNHSSTELFEELFDDERTFGVNRPSAATSSGNAVSNLRFDKIKHLFEKREEQRRCRSKDNVLQLKCRSWVCYRKDVRKDILHIYSENDSLSYSLIAQLANCSRWTVKRTVKKMPGGFSMKDKPRSSRPEGSSD